eukprot:7593844-Pyramimonas_sp.AAC.1
MDMSHFSTSCKIRAVDQYEMVPVAPHTQLMKSGKPQSRTGTRLITCYRCLAQKRGSPDIV